MKKLIIFIMICFAALFFISCQEETEKEDANAPKTSADPTAFEIRRDTYIEQTVKQGHKNAYTELVFLSQGLDASEDVLRGMEGLEKLNQRLDCADFRLPALLNIMFKHADSGQLSQSFLDDAKTTLLGFKYWPDEMENEGDFPYVTGEDGVTETDDMAFYTENHFILFSSGAYLTAQLYPDETFVASGETGAVRKAKFKSRVMRWLELRYKSGFSEWLSNVYYNEDIPALLALIELADDQEIVKSATMVLDLMMLDMALNQYRGGFTSTHGRTYKSKMSGLSDSTASVFKLLFDTNASHTGNYSATLLALSEKYQLPKVISEIAADSERTEFENRQRMGIKIEEAANWGLSYDETEDAMTFLTLEAYTHPQTIDLFYKVLNAYNWWGKPQLGAFRESKMLLDYPELTDQILSDPSIGFPAGYTALFGDPVSTRPELATFFEKDLTRNMRPEVNIYTYRTPDYMLSTAQDWRPGYGGDQQSIWQATLGLEATCFTTHPANTYDGGNPSPNFWVGNGTMPRAIQVKNVVISLYDVETAPGLYVNNQPLYTHAYFPKSKYDEVIKEGGWFFARKDDGYLALWSSDPSSDWETNDYEIQADGEKTIWITELGRQTDYGDFEAFKTAIKATTLDATADSLEVVYQSPSQGTLEMGWSGYLKQNDATVDVSDYKRYENPYSSSAFPGDAIRFSFNGETLDLNFDSKTRTVSSFLE